MRVVQTALGIILGLGTLGLIVGGLSYLSLQQLSRSPEKPAFAAATPSSDAVITQIQDGSYPAVVVYQGELVVRDSPALAGKAVSKIKLDETVTVTETSDDGRFQKIHIGSENVDGWVSNGNLKRAQ